MLIYIIRLYSPVISFTYASRKFRISKLLKQCKKIVFSKLTTVRSEKSVCQGSMTQAQTGIVHKEIKNSQRIKFLNQNTVNDQTKSQKPTSHALYSENTVKPKFLYELPQSGNIKAPFRA